VVNLTPRPLYPQERPGSHWVDPRTGLDVCETSRLHRDSIPGLPARSDSLYRCPLHHDVQTIFRAIGMASQDAGSVYPQTTVSSLSGHGKRFVCKYTCQRSVDCEYNPFRVTDSSWVRGRGRRFFFPQTVLFTFYSYLRQYCRIKMFPRFTFTFTFARCLTSSATSELPA